MGRLIGIWSSVRSGRLNLTVSAGTLGYAGIYGYEWSSRGSSTRYDGVTTPSAYYLDFNATGVHPSGGPTNRFVGFPLRCLTSMPRRGADLTLSKKMLLFTTSFLNNVNGSTDWVRTSDLGLMSPTL